MNPNEPNDENIIMRCPDVLDCAECDEAVECLTDIIYGLAPEQKSELLRLLRGETAP